MVSENSVRFYYDPILGLVHWDFKKKKDSQYNLDKGRWVRIKSGAPKVKLRRYIEEKSLYLSKLSRISRAEIRRMLIFAYNEEGIEGVNGTVNYLIKEIIKIVEDGE